MNLRRLLPFASPPKRYERMAEERLAERKEAFALARAEAERTGGMVCATVDPSGQPLYFVAESSASDDVLGERAFVLRYGRRPTEGEKQIHGLIKSRVQKDTAVDH